MVAISPPKVVISSRSRKTIYARFFVPKNTKSAAAIDATRGSAPNAAPVLRPTLRGMEGHEDMNVVVDSRPAFRGIRWAYIGLGALGMLVLAALAFVTFRPILVLPLIVEAPHYALADEQGTWLLDSDLRGTIVLYNFTYAGCAEACSQTSPAMRAVQDRLAEVEAQGAQVSLVTISFDPARDTPTALSAYAARWGADPRRWRFATGAPADLKEIIGRGFRTYYKANADGTFTFDPAFVLVDGDGIIRAEYRTATPSIDSVLRDIRLVAEEARNSTGTRRLAYEAAHLFVCYPR